MKGFRISTKLSFGNFASTLKLLAVDYEEGTLDDDGLRDKASKKGIKAFEKVGAPVFGQWNILTPLYSGGPLYLAQAMVITPPQELAGPFTITIRPVTDIEGEGGNGRLLVSGRADSSLVGQFAVTLMREETGQAPETSTVRPPVKGDEWLAEFDDLSEGAYTLSTAYTGDVGRVDVPIHITHQL